MSETVILDADEIRAEDYREQVCDWLRQQGLDPKRVRRVEVRHRTATVTEFVFDADGGLVLDRSGHDVVTSTRTVTVDSMPPQ